MIRFNPFLQTRCLVPNVIATGGIITEQIDNGITYKVHRFNTDGTFTIIKGGESLDYLVVGGGGGGAGTDSAFNGGGGGAGGAISSTFTTQPVTVSAGTHAITIGGGGTGGSLGGQGQQGGTTVFGTIDTALGGDGGTRLNGTNGIGGSAGVVSGATPGAGFSGNGTAGGGGGGGIGNAGGDRSGIDGGNGGNGFDATTYIGTSFGQSGFFSGGGGGGAANTDGTRGDGGLGGGGNGGTGAVNFGQAGRSTNTGGGGGGNGFTLRRTGGGGDRGIVVIKYPKFIDTCVPPPPPTPTISDINWSITASSTDPNITAGGSITIFGSAGLVLATGVQASGNGQIQLPAGELTTIGATASNANTGETLTSEAVLTLTIIGGNNPAGNPFVVTSTTGTINTNYIFPGDASGYTLNVDVVYNPSLDPDVTAFLAAAEITDPTIETAINDLVVGLKAEAIWDKMLAIYPFVGGTSTTHKWNLKNPVDTDAAFRLTFNGGLTHNSNGVTGNGSNAFYNTHITPVLDLQQNSASGWIYNRAGFGFDCGALNIGSFGFQFAANFNGSFSVRANDNSAQNLSAAAPGFFGINRNTSTSYQVWRSFTPQTININTTGLPTVNIVGLALNAGNDGIVLHGANNHAFTAVGESLTDTQAINLQSLVQTFQTELNRQV